MDDRGPTIWTPGARVFLNQEQYDMTWLVVQVRTPRWTFVYYFFFFGENFCLLIEECDVWDFYYLPVVFLIFVIVIYNRTFKKYAWITLLNKEIICSVLYETRLFEFSWETKVER